MRRLSTYGDVLKSAAVVHGVTELRTSKGRRRCGGCGRGRGYDEGDSIHVDVRACVRHSLVQIALQPEIKRLAKMRSGGEMELSLAFVGGERLWRRERERERDDDDDDVLKTYFCTSAGDKRASGKITYSSL